MRNRTPAEVEANIEGHDRDKREEDFFDKLPWNTLPKSRRGAQALRKYLTDLLCTRIQLIFPLMRKTIQERRLSAASQLKTLGEPRDSIEQKRAYLSRIAQSFHSQASASLHGHYGGIKLENMKLRKTIRDANDGFVQEIKKSGHLVPFADLPHIPRMRTEASSSTDEEVDAAAGETLGDLETSGDSEPDNMQSKKV